MHLPSNKRLFIAFMGLLGALAYVMIIGFCLNRPDDTMVALGFFLTFWLFVYVRSYISFLRRIFSE